MREFTVTWWPPAEQDLTELWIASSNRQVIADAANDIEKRLAHSPITAGQTVSKGLRGLANEPLYVQFKVDEDDRKVTILSVRLASSQASGD